MKQSHLNIISSLLLLLILWSCKEEDPTYYEYSKPSFVVYQKSGEPQSVYSYCSSHDVYMDSVRVTNPINIKSMQYYHGQEVLQSVHFLVGDNFVYQAGNWSFIFYGRRAVNGLVFSVFIEKEF